MGPWCDDSVILSAIARRLSKAVADLEPYFADIAAKANTDAAVDIATIMLGLGYTPAQLDAWDFVATYNERLACYFAFSTPPIPDITGPAEKALDCRDQLRKCTAIVIGGAAVGPPVGGSDVGGIQSGTISAVDELIRETCHWWR